jgi:predicted nucleotidyltransferase
MPQNIVLELDNLLKEIKNTSNINTIYLFGSYAYGNPNEDSDLDICIITNDKSSRKIDILKAIRKSISKVATMPIDLLVYYSDEFKERSKIECTMEYQILLQGVKIYGQ